MEILDCGHEPSKHSQFMTGYGVQNGKKYCYECCAKNELKAMQEDGRATLYLVKTVGEYEVSNWTGSLRFKPVVRKGKHNIARSRYDAWFMVNGQKWHGVNYGEFSQLLHCKKMK